MLAEAEQTSGRKNLRLVLSVVGFAAVVDLATVAVVVVAIAVVVVVVNWWWRGWWDVRN